MKKETNAQLGRLGILTWGITKENAGNRSGPTLHIKQRESILTRAIFIRKLPRFVKEVLKRKSKLVLFTSTKLATFTQRSLKSVDSKCFLSVLIFNLS